LKTLKTERKGLQRLLASRQALSDQIVSEIEADAAKYGDARRTLIEEVAPVALQRAVPDEPVTITLSRQGWIRSRQGHALDATQFAWKSGDGPLAIIETRTIHSLVVLDTQGRAYTIRAADVPGGRGDGVPITTLLELPAGARVAHAISAEPGRKYLVAGTGGYGFVAAAEDMVSRVKAGKAFMTLEADEEPVAPVLLTPGRTHVAALAGNGKLLVFELAEMREIPRGRGLIVMALDPGDKLVAVGLAAATRVGLRGTNRNGREIEVALEGDTLAKHVLRRARKGYKIAQKIKATGFA
jgi:topoisomerase-4 subunit A